MIIDIQFGRNIRKIVNRIIDFIITVIIYSIVTSIVFGESSLIAQEDQLNRQLYELIVQKNIHPNDRLKKATELLKIGANPNDEIKIDKSVYRPKKLYRYSKRKNYSSKYIFTTPLHAAIDEEQYDVVAKMFKYGANANHPDKEGELPINLALRSKNSSIVNLLLGNGVDIAKIDLTNTSDKELIKSLVQKGADPNISPGDDIYLINRYVSSNDMSMIEFLLNNGAETKYIDLSKSRNVKIIEKLVNKGANPETIDISYAFGRRHKKNNYEELRYLLKLIPDFEKLKFHTFREVFKVPEVTNILLDNGFSYKVRDGYNECPLIYGAIEYSDTTTVKRILKMGEKIDVKCEKRDYTPLIFAIKEKKPEMVKFLIKNGANTKVKYNGKSLLEYAKSRNLPEDIINYLKQNQ